MFFLLFKRKSKNKALKVILFYILYCILNEGLSFYLQSIESLNFKYLLYAFTVFEYSFFCYFTYLIFNSEKTKKIIPIIWIAFILFATVDYIFFNHFNGFDSFTIGIESIIVILLCISYLLIQIKKTNNFLIYSTFNFWVIITFLIYFSGTFFLYLLTDHSRNNPSFQKLYFIINISFNILKNILLCVAMTMKLNDSLNQKTIIPNLDDDLFIPKKI